MIQNWKFTGAGGPQDATTLLRVQLRRPYSLLDLLVAGRAPAAAVNFCALTSRVTVAGVIGLVAPREEAAVSLTRALPEKLVGVLAGRPR